MAGEKKKRGPSATSALPIIYLPSTDLPTYLPYLCVAFF
jgi:hypothetical protein